MAGRRVTRKWEVFAGRNRFWCDGRLMTAPHPGVFVLTLALITGTCALHFAFDAPFLAARVSGALPAAGAALCAVTLAALLRTALSDPGIIPRAAPPEADAEADVGAARPPPRAREVLVRGRPVKLKYCFTCKMFRPPRASHCSLCDNCVERFDHHCPWVGNCVGKRNYRHFYLFVVSLAFLAVFVLACAAAHLALLARGAGLAAALRASPASALAAAVCFLAVWSVLGLAGFHTYLASTDQTTNEDIKGAFSARRGQPNPNPYSRGNACANCWHVLCGPLQPSLIDRRGLVATDPRDELPPRFAQALCAQPLPHAPLPHAPLPHAPLPHAPLPHAPLPPAPPQLADGPALGARHAYMNHSLDLDPVPLHEVCLSGGAGGAGGAGGGAGGASGGGAAVAARGALSASRLRLLHDTTMIDAALDLDEPDLPPPLPHAPHPHPHAPHPHAPHPHAPHAPHPHAPHPHAPHPHAPHPHAPHPHARALAV